MKEKEEIFLEETEKPDCYRYGEYLIEVEFSPDGPTFLELLQQYIEKKLDGLTDGKTAEL